MRPATKGPDRCTEPAHHNNHSQFCVWYFITFFLCSHCYIFCFTLFIFSAPSYSRNTTDDQTAGGIREYFKSAANAKAVVRAAQRRELETILLDEIKEAEDSGENGKEGRPIPVQIGHRPGNTKSVLKRQLPNNELDYYPDVYTDDDNTSTTKLRTSNV